MNDIGKIIGDRLRNYRKKVKLSQEETAHRASIHTSFLGEVERNEKSPTLESLVKITSALNITLEELFRQTQPSQNSKEAKTLSHIINQLHSLSAKELEDVSKMIDLMLGFRKK
ncbi:helix-turn-helix domain-containing protein [Paenibacillus sp. Soil750]|uniref:helix-turn-helix domain-containing protein n=1 Tax=Paenibacillus sp. Soil750 TaxID=1736398 RepID=UPI0006F5ABA8|nr:helix-turn-helix transcriptional regulator [Paenibacillus sp. Soil750]KRE70861.1 hypothetical protein ASL11_11245 [Paenibacillus sp. Soil750]